MTRSLPRWLAPVVEQLELHQPSTVTIDQLRAIVTAVGMSTSASTVARRLRELGWLLPTGVRGVYEFAPGAHAGAIGRGDPFSLVQAVRAANPGSTIVVALGSAAWAHGCADRAPDVLEVSLASTESPSLAIRRGARASSFDANIKPQIRKGAPVQSLATMLVHMAAKPRDVRSWDAVAEWIEDVAAEVGDREIERELEGRPESVRRRLGYLLQGLRPDLAEVLRGTSSSKVWFGPRAPLRRHDEPWAIADTVLPFDPASLGRAVSGT